MEIRFLNFVKIIEYLFASKFNKFLWEINFSNLKLEFAILTPRSGSGFLIFKITKISGGPGPRPRDN